MWPFNQIEIPWLFLLGLALLIVILLRRFYRYRGRKKGGNQAAEVQKQGERAEPRSDLPLVDAPPEMTRWHVEMYEVSRDIKAELDSKMLAAQVLIRLADESTVRLQAAVARLEQAGHPPSEAMQTIEQLAAELSRLADAASTSLPAIELPAMPGEDGQAGQNSP